MKSAAPRYDRVVSLMFVVLIGLAIVFLVDANPNTLRLRLGGDLPVIPISWILVASLVIITSAGSDLLVRAHPQMQHRTLPVVNLGFIRFEIAPAAWILPSFSLIGSFAFFRLFSGALEGIAFVLALVAAGGSLLAVLVAQHYALDRDQDLSQRAHLARRHHALDGRLQTLDAEVRRVIRAALCLLALAYRYYSAFLAARVATLDALWETPARVFGFG